VNCCSDEEMVTERFIAYLSPTNKLPLIIGFKDLLDIKDLFTRFEGGKAFVEFY